MYVNRQRLNVQFVRCVFVYIGTLDIVVKIIKQYLHVLYFQVPNLSASWTQNCSSWQASITISPQLTTSKLMDWWRNRMPVPPSPCEHASRIKRIGTTFLIPLHFPSGHPNITWQAKHHLRWCLAIYLSCLSNSRPDLTTWSVPVVMLTS